MVAAAETSWLECLVPGDQVIEHTERGRRIVRIARMTRTLAIIDHGPSERKYRRKNGWAVGGPYYARGHITAYEEIEARPIRLEAAQRKAWSLCQGIPFHRFAALSLEQCADVLACFRRMGLIDAAVSRKEPS